MYNDETKTVPMWRKEEMKKKKEKNEKKKVL
jgi:hypothetical protein